MGCGKNSCGGYTLSVCGVGLGLGVTFAVPMFALGVLAYFGIGQNLVSALGSIYYGYAPTVTGVLFGVLWGFLDGFISGVILAVVYNFSIRHCPCKACVKRREECSTAEKS